MVKDMHIPHEDLSVAIEVVEKCDEYLLLCVCACMCVSICEQIDVYVLKSQEFYNLKISL